MIDGKITPDEYIGITEITTSHVTTKISEFVTSKPSEIWQESYISYMDALKKFNSYVIETKVYANMIKDGDDDSKKSQVFEKINILKKETDELVEKSNSLRP